MSGVWFFSLRKKRSAKRKAFEACFVAQLFAWAAASRWLDDGSSNGNEHEKSGDAQLEYCAVTTTIFEPNEAITQVLRSDVSKLFVVGDFKTDADLWDEFERRNPKVEFLSPERQRQLRFSIVRHIPWNHFARKSIGYLRAVQAKCVNIFDFDDDNHLTQMRLERVWNATAKKVEIEHHVLNPYPYFGPFAAAQNQRPPRIWPRGFPLQFISDPETANVDGHATPENVWHERVAVIQSLADHNPDVDAVYRMTQQLPIDFTRKEEVLLAPVGVFMPWNSQATLLTQKAFFSLLLPASVPGRVSDIWRSYIGTRLLWDTEYASIAACSAMVKQFRNPHSYMQDFLDEQDLYTKVDELLFKLASWTSERHRTLPDAYLDLIKLLVQESFLEKSDFKLAKAWVRDLHELGYKWPTFRRDRISAFTPQGRRVVDDRFVSGSPTAQDLNDAIKVNFVLSTRVQDRALYEERLRLHLRMFADPHVYSITLVLDDDVDENHEWSAQIRNSSSHFVEFIAYASLPEDHVELFDGIGRGYQKSRGYDRNQWNNFHSDLYAQRGSRIIAVVDSDTCIHTFITPEDYLTKDGKIILHATAGGSHWAAGDSIALGFVPEYDLMWTDIFPIFFWRDTFQHVREEIGDRLGNGSFATAFKKFNRALYSQFNIIGNWALQHEPARYEVVVHASEEHGRSVDRLTLGAHKEHGWCSERDVFIDSCKTAFGQAGDQSMTKLKFDAHADRVSLYTRNMEKTVYAAMKTSCMDFLNRWRGISCNQHYECRTTRA